MGSLNTSSISSAELALARQLACNEAVLVSSGLSALEIALMACGAGPGSVVACDALYPFAAMAVANVGARPVAFDILPESGLPSWESVVQCRSAGATILVLTSYFGRRAANDDLAAQANAIGLQLVEDRAQCFGRHAERWPAIFSFQAGKFLSCGFGGAIALPQDLSAAAFRRQVHLGWWPRTTNEGTGWSSGWRERIPGRSARMPPVAAALLERQLNAVDASSKALAEFLSELREEVELAAGSDAVVPEAEGVRLVSVHVRCAQAKTSVANALCARGVDWGSPTHPPVTEWPGFGGHWLDPDAPLTGTRELLSRLVLVSLDTWKCDR